MTLNLLSAGLLIVRIVGIYRTFTNVLRDYKHL